MIKLKRLVYLVGCILGVSLIVPMIAREGVGMPGEAKRSFAEPQETPKPAKWRRVRFTGATCPKCDSSIKYAAVEVYSDYDGQGRMQGYLPGKYRADEGKLNKVGNDAVSSVQVEEGYIVRLCQHEGDGNGAGKCLDFAEGQHNLPNEMDNETSFIWVWAVRR